MGYLFSSLAPVQAAPESFTVTLRCSVTVVDITTTTGKPIKNSIVVLLIGSLEGPGWSERARQAQKKPAFTVRMVVLPADFGLNYSIFDKSAATRHLYPKMEKAAYRRFVVNDINKMEGGRRLPKDKRSI